VAEVEKMGGVTDSGAMHVAGECAQTAPLKRLYLHGRGPRDHDYGTRGVGRGERGVGESAKMMREDGLY
jgi:hypothetical protein